MSPLVKAKCSRLVIIEDHDGHDVPHPDLHLVLAGRVQRHLQEELLVGLPVVVVHDLHGDLNLGLAGGEGEDPVDADVVLTLIGAPVNGVDLDTDLVRDLSQPQHGNLWRTFRNKSDLGNTLELKKLFEYLMSKLKN